MGVPVRIVPVAPLRVAPLRVAPLRVAPLRVAPLRVAPLRVAPVRVAPLRVAAGVPVRVALAVPVGVAVALAVPVGVASVRVALGVPVRVAVALGVPAGVASVWVALGVPVGVTSVGGAVVASGRRAGGGGPALGADVGPGHPVAPARRLGVAGPAALLAGLFGSGAGVRLPVVRSGIVGAVVAPRVGHLMLARPAVRLVGPGPAHVRTVGSGRCQRRYLGPPDGARPTSRGRWLMVDADVARIALARELWVPLACRLDDPGWLGGIVPPVGVAATHPPDPSLRPGRRGEAAPAATREPSTDPVEAATADRPQPLAVTHRARIRPLTAAPRWSARVRSLTAMSPRRKWSRWAPRGTGEVACPGTEWLRKEGSGAGSVTATAAPSPEPKRYPIDPDI